MGERGGFCEGDVGERGLCDGDVGERGGFFEGDVEERGLDDGDCGLLDLLEGEVAPDWA